MTTSSEYVFNMNALIFSGSMLFLILFVHAIYMFAVNASYEKMVDKMMLKQNYHIVRLLFFVMAFILTMSHLLEIYIWGIALSISGLVPNSHHAMVFAGSTYTTVGFGTNPLPQGWQLVMVVIALSGMIAFGWTISVLISMTTAVNAAIQKEKEKKNEKKKTLK